jgi:hypothetical protein
MDLDDPRAFDDLGTPPTTTWETRPGRFAMRFKLTDTVQEVLPKFGFKQEQAQKSIFIIMARTIRERSNYSEPIK